MSQNCLQKDSIQQGQFPVAVFKKDGLVHRASPIADIHPIQFSNFTEGQPRDFYLSNFLETDYQVIGMDFDIPEDDEGQLENNLDRPKYNNFYIEIRTFENSVQKKRYYYSVSERLMTFPKMFLNHHHKWQIKCSGNIKDLTFYCLPIYLSKPIIFA